VDKWIEDFVNIIKSCRYDNTYKMAWAKALVETAMDSYACPDGTDTCPVTLRSMAEKIVRYYWNQTIFFNLEQGSNPKKPPSLQTLANTMIGAYRNVYGVHARDRYERVEWKIRNMDEYDRWMRQAVRALKTDVSYRFLNLDGVTYEDIYTYVKGDDVLLIQKEHLLTLKTYAFMLLDLINYRWSLILETFNHSPRIAKKVRIIDDDKVRNGSLGKFHKYLDLDNPVPTCFICGKPIHDTPSVDHVIPWSYMYSDDLWNLVYVHKSCNSSKSDMIPGEDMITRLEARNEILINKLASLGHHDKAVFELMLAKEENLVRKFWVGCQ
jgi:hypothetical protein